MRILRIPVVALVLQIYPKYSSAENIEIAFSEDDSYSIEVARIDVGDTINVKSKIP